MKPIKRVICTYDFAYLDNVNHFASGDEYDVYREDERDLIVMNYNLVIVPKQYFQDLPEIDKFKGMTKRTRDFVSGLKELFKDFDGWHNYTNSYIHNLAKQYYIGRLAQTLCDLERRKIIEIEYNSNRTIKRFRFI